MALIGLYDFGHTVKPNILQNYDTHDNDNNDD
eukprot:CAMPEP_0202466040 /NCGR_PEP_ID=MMETSP1360-20130828/67467_1 /ASSEMBLY_ACC=CAM_ASM_000848 /TAXON_ID=515479 /ORGANISM="Licmophora paradoxa, Strain CCMP2313" /LENGTH=31 /DNA_ID= /DNA_START= /DNA_END= /DNA_ORIENTATION=